MIINNFLAASTTILLTFNVSIIKGLIAVFASMYLVTYPKLKKEALIAKSSTLLGLSSVLILGSLGSTFLVGLGPSTPGGWLFGSVGYGANARHSQNVQENTSDMDKRLKQRNDGVSMLLSWQEIFRLSRHERNCSLNTRRRRPAKAIGPPRPGLRGPADLKQVLPYGKARKHPQNHDAKS